MWKCCECFRELVGDLIRIYVMPVSEEILEVCIACDEGAK